MQVSSVSSSSAMPQNNKAEKPVSKIDKKIAELKKRILYLENINQRKTHGGKRFRAKKLSRRNERNDALQRLKKLQNSKKEHSPVKKEESIKDSPPLTQDAPSNKEPFPENGTKILKAIAKALGAFHSYF